MHDEDGLVVPEVTTLAKPKTDLLLAARVEMQRNSDLRKAFEDALTAKNEIPDIKEQLTSVAVDLLFSTIKGEESEIQEVARYLVDETFQIGDALLISTKTGLPVYKLTEKDFWQPPGLVREDADGTTHIVQAPLRIRPELEGMILRREHDDERENNLKRELRPKLFQTESLKQHDPRLETVTRSGRTKFLTALKETLPDLFPHNVGGTAREFIHAFQLGDVTPAQVGFVGYPGLTAISRATSISLTDQLARNFKFDQGGAVRSSLANGWARQIAEKIAELAESQDQIKVVDFATWEPKSHIYVASEQAQRALRALGVDLVFAVRNTDLVLGIDAFCVGRIITHAYDAKHRVLHDKWQIVGQLDYDLWLNWNAIEVLRFTNLPTEVHQGEIVG